MGLSTPPSNLNSSGQGTLIDVLSDIYSNGSGSPAVHNSKKYVIVRSTIITSDRSVKINFLFLFILLSLRFVFKNNGVLFENDLIQIGVKSEYRQNLGRLGLFYGNKTQVTLQNFTPILVWSSENATKLNVQIKPVEPTLEAGAQIQQMLTAECIDDYADTPSIDITFRYNGVQQKLNVKLPLTLNKFFEPTEMNGESFFARWKNLGG